jgi:hypothetical protein
MRWAPLTCIAIFKSHRTTGRGELVMMRKGHRSAAAPVVVATVWGGLTAGLPLVVAVLMGLLVDRTCMWPDLDHHAKRGPIVWIIRWVSWRVWLLTRTTADRPKTMTPVDKSRRRGACAVLGRFMDRIGFAPKLRMIGDTHRDFTHCIEGALVFGLFTMGCTAPFLMLADQPSVVSYLAVIGVYSPCWGAGVFLGCCSHIGADSMTPSGVPVSIILNWLLGYPTWQRWCLGWVWIPTRLWLPLPTWRRWRPGVRWVQVKYPRLSVLRIHGRKQTCEHRGLFSTDSAGERLLARPLLIAAALALIAVATGITGPLFDALTGIVFGS